MDERARRADPNHVGDRLGQRRGRDRIAARQEGANDGQRVAVENVDRPVSPDREVSFATGERDRQCAVAPAAANDEPSVHLIEHDERAVGGNVER